MSDQNVAATNNASQVHASEDAKKETKSQEKEIKGQCEDCLKTSKTKGADGKPEINKNEAIEKLDLLKQTTEKVEIKAKLDNLITQIEQADPKTLVNPDQLKQIIEQSFKQTQEIQTHQQFNQMADSANPFKTDNPFAPKVITRTDKASQIENDPKKDTPKESLEQAEDLGFWQKIKKVFGAL